MDGVMSAISSCRDRMLEELEANHTRVPTAQSLASSYALAAVTIARDHWATLGASLRPPPSVGGRLAAVEAECAELRATVRHAVAVAGDVLRVLVGPRAPSLVDESPRGAMDRLRAEAARLLGEITALYREGLSESAAPTCIESLMRGAEVAATLLDEWKGRNSGTDHEVAVSQATNALRGQVNRLTAQLEAERRQVQQLMQSNRIVAEQSYAQHVAQVNQLHALHNAALCDLREQYDSEIRALHVTVTNFVGDIHIEFLQRLSELRGIPNETKGAISSILRKILEQGIATLPKGLDPTAAPEKADPFDPDPLISSDPEVTKLAELGYAQMNQQAAAKAKALQWQQIMQETVSEYQEALASASEREAKLQAKYSIASAELAALKQQCHDEWQRAEVATYEAQGLLTQAELQHLDEVDELHRRLIQLEERAEQAEGFVTRMRSIPHRAVATQTMKSRYDSRRSVVGLSFTDRRGTTSTVESSISPPRTLSVATTSEAGGVESYVGRDNESDGGRFFMTEVKSTDVQKKLTFVIPSGTRATAQPSGGPRPAAMAPTAPTAPRRPSGTAGRASAPPTAVGAVTLESAAKEGPPGGAKLGTLKKDAKDGPLSGAKFRPLRDENYGPLGDAMDGPLGDATEMDRSLLPLAASFTAAPPQSSMSFMPEDVDALLSEVNEDDQVGPPPQNEEETIGRGDGVAVSVDTPLRQSSPTSPRNVGDVAAKLREIWAARQATRYNFEGTSSERRGEVGGSPYSPRSLRGGSPHSSPRRRLSDRRASPPREPNPDPQSVAPVLAKMAAVLDSSGGSTWVGRLQSALQSHSRPLRWTDGTVSQAEMLNVIRWAMCVASSDDRERPSEHAARVLKRVSRLQEDIVALCAQFRLPTTPSGTTEALRYDSSSVATTSTAAIAALLPKFASLVQLCVCLDHYKGRAVSPPRLQWILEDLERCASPQRSTT